MAASAAVSRVWAAGFVPEVAAASCERIRPSICASARPITCAAWLGEASKTGLTATIAAEVEKRRRRVREEVAADMIESPLCCACRFQAARNSEIQSCADMNRLDNGIADTLVFIVQ
jgi:hypothetical protein